MTQGSHRVPTGPGEILCDPPLTEWERMVSRNREQAAGWSFSMGGLDAGELRRRARAGLRAEAGRYGHHLSMPSLEDRDEDVILLTGHQPILYHPGVWVKNFAVEQVAAAMGCLAVNLNVDSDDVARVEIPVPFRAHTAQTLERVKVAVASPVRGVSLERRPVPTPEEWGRFQARVDERLASCGLTGAREHFAAFVGAATTVISTSHSLADFCTGARRAYESLAGPGQYLEVPVSAMTARPEFLAFFAEWALDGPRLARLYNDKLDAYRQERGLRSNANPFPDLRTYGENVETPFWTIGPGDARRDLFVRINGPSGELVLNTQDGDIARVPARSPAAVAGALLEADLPVRPKAVALTLFHRLFASDLFVHGVGGAKYDQVTDAIIRAWLGIEPPEFAVVSASMHLPLPAPETPNTPVDVLNHKLRDLRYNPQRYALAGGQGDGRVDGEVADLARRKHELIAAIQSPGAAKRPLTRDIEAVNARLYRRLSPVVEETRRRLEASELAARQAGVARARDYPFCFFSPREVRALLTPVDAGKAGGQLSLCEQRCL